MAFRCGIGSSSGSSAGDGLHYSDSYLSLCLALEKPVIEQIHASALNECGCEMLHVSLWELHVLTCGRIFCFVLVWGFYFFPELYLSVRKCSLE